MSVSSRDLDEDEPYEIEGVVIYPKNSPEYRLCSGYEQELTDLVVELWNRQRN